MTISRKILKEKVVESIENNFFFYHSDFFFGYGYVNIGNMQLSREKSRGLNFYAGLPYAGISHARVPIKMTVLK